MTRRIALPALETVRTAIAHLAAAGKPPTVVALARHLGLANTTFRRNFPDITTDPNPPLSQPSPEGPAGVSQFEQWFCLSDATAFSATTDRTWFAGGLVFVRSDRT